MLFVNERLICFIQASCKRIPKKSNIPVSVAETNGDTQKGTPIDDLLNLL